ncbi:MAG: hypothetical protein J7L16_01395, partial [Deltaproteobacteria bacterium]|nr:hypothetical protein [Deltaproteobacteria bacterium]
DLKYRSTSAPLPPCTYLQQTGLRQTRRLQDLGGKEREQINLPNYASHFQAIFAGSKSIKTLK